MKDIRKPLIFLTTIGGSVLIGKIFKRVRPLNHSDQCTGIDQLEKTQQPLQNSAEGGPVEGLQYDSERSGSGITIIPEPSITYNDALRTNVQNGSALTVEIRDNSINTSTSNQQIRCERSVKRTKEVICSVVDGSLGFISENPLKFTAIFIIIGLGCFYIYDNKDSITAEFKSRRKKMGDFLRRFK